jgi:secreted PhoX family phosphatase
MVDPATSVVYETQDASPDAGFYKFVPAAPRELARGGELFMLKVKNRPNVDLGRSSPVGTRWKVEWVRIDDPTAGTVPTFEQGAQKGGASFRRLEGAWWGTREGFFVSTSGGADRQGQVFKYDPREETLTLIYEATLGGGADNPDNITVTPRGGLLLCEDNDSGPGWRAVPNRLMGLTLDGRTFPFAVNNLVLTRSYNDRTPAGDYRLSEWAGACYSPDGRWLFANIQTPGITFAITGPWGAGPL